MPKVKKATKKERGFARDYALTENGLQSALKNYDTKDPATAGVIAVENLKKPRVQEIIEDVKKTYAERFPDDLLERIHKDGLEANRVISANITYGEADEKTNDFIEVPDHAVRHKFLDSIYKIKGSYAPEKSVNLNIDVDATNPVKDAADKLNTLFRGGSESSDGTVPDPVGDKTQNQERSGPTN